MPTYDYVCQSCGRRVEVMHGVNDAGPTDCAACGGSLRKAMSLPAIVFKGSGWAKVDARNSSAAKPSSNKTEGGNGAGDTKPSDKSADKPTTTAGDTASSSGAGGD